MLMMKVSIVISQDWWDVLVAFPSKRPIPAHTLSPTSSQMHCNCASWSHSRLNTYYYSTEILYTYKIIWENCNGILRYVFHPLKPDLIPFWLNLCAAIENNSPAIFILQSSPYLYRSFLNIQHFDCYHFSAIFVITLWSHWNTQFIVLI